MGLIGRTQRMKDNDSDEDLTLPGVFGVAHTIFGIWAPQNPFIDKVDRVLSTVSVIRNWREGTTHDRSLREAERHMKKMGFTLLQKPVSKYGTGRYSALLDSLCHEHLIEWDYQERVFGIYRVQIYMSPWGQRIANICTKDWSYSYPMGPHRNMFIEGDATKWMENFRTHLWSKLRHQGASELFLRFTKTEKRDIPTLTAVGVEGDYISEGAEKSWMDLGKLASRCQHFQAKGYSRKILFYGPPGTGKTTLARKLAGKIDGGRVLRVDFEAFSETPSGIQTLIEYLQPTVLLFDDFDRMFERDCSTLSEMESLEGLSENLVVIGTANYLGKLDLALLRPGRFDEVLLVPEPGDKHREAIIRHYLTKSGVTGVDPVELCELTKGFSPVDIRELVRCASAVGIDHVREEITRLQKQRDLYTGAATDPKTLQSLLGTGGYGNGGHCNVDTKCEGPAPVDPEDICEDAKECL